MGLFDKVKKTAEIANEFTQKIQSQDGSEPDAWDFAIAGVDLLVDLAERGDIQKININGMSAFGNTVSEAAPYIRTVLQYVNDNRSKSCVCLSTSSNSHKKYTVEEIKKKSSIHARDKSVEEKIPIEALTAINPNLFFMAATLILIEARMESILDVQKKTLAFLQEDKESQVEGDMATLNGMLSEYKFNWDNDSYRANHHKLAIDIKRSAEQNIIFYQKQTTDVLKKEVLINAAFLTKDKQAELRRCLYNYRLSLYNYSFAAFLEVMQLGNFSEDFITQVLGKMQEYTDKYKQVFENCCTYLQAKGDSTVEANLLKGIGVAGKAVGSLLGGIAGTKTNDWLTANSARFGDDNTQKQHETLAQFRQENADPGNEQFISGLQQTKKLYNHTDKIFIDNDYIYFIPTDCVYFIPTK